MAHTYSIAEARHNLAAIVHELDRGTTVELTRRGEPVAVLLSMRAYRRLNAPRSGFWEAYQAFRQAFPLVELDIAPEVFADVRDQTSGRERSW